MKTLNAPVTGFGSIYFRTKIQKAELQAYWKHVEISYILEIPTTSRREFVFGVIGVAYSILYGILHQTVMKADIVFVYK